jgi:hypothetical protein
MLSLLCTSTASLYYTLLFSLSHLTLFQSPPSLQQGIAASNPGWLDGSVNALLQIARAEDAALARETSTAEVTA